MNIFKHN